MKKVINFRQTRNHKKREIERVDKQPYIKNADFVLIMGGYDPCFVLIMTMQKKCALFCHITGPIQSI